jgi:hypothetical protein
MAGTREGGQKAAATNKKRYGDDFYQRNAYKAQEAWNRNGRKPRGFEYAMVNGNRELIQQAGAKGGALSRRGSKGE